MSRRGLHTPKPKAQNVAYGPHVSTVVSSWVFDSIDSKLALEDSARASKTPFRTKSWIKTEKPAVLDDGEDQSVAFVNIVAQVFDVPDPADPGLTASDIRGAVGGEAIPGIASEGPVNTSQEPATESKDQVKTETPALDGDGDVIMS